MSLRVYALLLLIPLLAAPTPRNVKKGSNPAHRSMVIDLLVNDTTVSQPARSAMAQRDVQHLTFSVASEEGQYEWPVGRRTRITSASIYARAAFGAGEQCFAGLLLDGVTQAWASLSTRAAITCDAGRLTGGQVETIDDYCVRLDVEGTVVDEGQVLAMSWTGAGCSAMSAALIIYRGERVSKVL